MGEVASEKTRELRWERQESLGILREMHEASRYTHLLVQDKSGQTESVPLFGEMDLQQGQ